jgi:hypothetical protein
MGFCVRKDSSGAALLPFHPAILKPRFDLRDTKKRTKRK